MFKHVDAQWPGYPVSRCPEKGRVASFLWSYTANIQIGMNEMYEVEAREPGRKMGGEGRRHYTFYCAIVDQLLLLTALPGQRRRVLGAIWAASDTRWTRKYLGNPYFH